MSWQDNNYNIVILIIQAVSQDLKSLASQEIWVMLDSMKGAVTALYSNLLMARTLRAISKARYFVISHLNGNLLWLMKLVLDYLTSHKSTLRQEGMMAGISEKSTHTAKLRGMSITFLSMLTPFSTSGWMEINLLNFII